MANRSLGKRYHFLYEEKTIYGIVPLAENTSGYQRVQGNGRIVKIMDKKDIVVQIFEHKDDVLAAGQSKIWIFIVADLKNVEN